MTPTVNYEIVHRTVYEYSSEVSVSQHVVHLTPRNLTGQQCLRHELLVEPEPALLTSREDYFGNPTRFFTMAGAHRTLVVTARSEVTLNPRRWPTPDKSPAWELARGCADRTANLTIEAQEYIYPSTLIPALPGLSEYARPSFPASRPLLEAVLDLTRRIFTDFTFDPKATTVATPLEEVIGKRRGVCQDFAHFQIGCLRALGLPARYVSGYLETLPPPGKTKLVGSDASHAWVQVFTPDHGWIEVDPTNNVMPSDRHIVVGWGRDFEDVSPIRGVISGGGKHTLSVAVDVTPLTAKVEVPPSQTQGQSQNQSSGNITPSA
jgi:transglutaminase-like putative cysteine protease